MRRRCRLVRRQMTGDNFALIDLAADDDAPLAPFAPTQCIMMSVQMAGEERPDRRCYYVLRRLAGHRDVYQIAVKRLAPSPPAGEGTPPGKVSTWLCREASEDACLEFDPPMGGIFDCERDGTAPLVLVGLGFESVIFVPILERIREVNLRRPVTIVYQRATEDDGFVLPLLEESIEGLQDVCLSVVSADASPQEVAARAVAACADMAASGSPGSADPGIAFTGDVVISVGFRIATLFDAICHGLTDWGVEGERLHFESWGTTSSGGAEAVGGVGVPLVSPDGTADAVRFTTYHPTALLPDDWQTLVAYVHAPDAVAAVEADRARRLGDVGGIRRRSDAPLAAVARGAEITVIPALDGCRFNPPWATLFWLEDVQAVEFRVAVDPAAPGFAPGQAVNGTVSYYVGPVLVAENRIWAALEEPDTYGVQGRDAPHAAEKASVGAYRAIFVSYSRRDNDVVDALEAAYKALGMTFLRDVDVLRSGEDWDARLLEKISDAEVFQLCWSEHAAKSPHVEREWRYALSLNRSGFIRPCFWADPMPRPPVTLAHLHFQRLALARPRPDGDTRH